MSLCWRNATWSQTQRRDNNKPSEADVCLSRSLLRLEYNFSLFVHLSVCVCVCLSWLISSCVHLDCSAGYRAIEWLWNISHSGDSRRSSWFSWRCYGHSGPYFHAQCKSRAQHRLTVCMSVVFFLLVFSWTGAGRRERWRCCKEPTCVPLSGSGSPHFLSIQCK